MGAPEDEHIFGVQLRESANDGSDFPNADADYRKLFLGEDGILHLKDSAGTVTDIGGGGITVEDEGTPLATAATTLDFVGSGVTASGTGATKTITISAGGGGGLTLLEQHTASSSASLDFTSFISATYDEYLFEGLQISPATTGQSLRMRIGTGGGPTYDSGANYFGGLAGGNSAGGSFFAGNAGGSSHVVAGTTTATTPHGYASFSLRLVRPQDSAVNRHIFGTAIWHDGTNQVFANIGGVWANNSAAMTAVQFLFSSGNITAGIIRGYGIEK